MAPINLPDGSQVSEIVLPDGSTASEVVAPDGSTVFSAIPDVGLKHQWYAPQASNTTTLPDTEGSLDLSASGDPQFGDINGNQTMLYDGSDDDHSAGSAPSFGTDGAWTVVFVTDPVDTSSKESVVGIGNTGSTDGGFEIAYRWDNSEFQIAHPGQGAVFGGTPATGAQVGVATFDGSTAVLEINRSAAINSSLSQPRSPAQSTAVGQNGAGRYYEGSVGVVGYEPGGADQTRRDELADTFADAFDILI